MEEIYLVFVYKGVIILIFHFINKKNPL